jgi:Ca2+-binding RTX toxin-like protein
VGRLSKVVVFVVVLVVAAASVAVAANRIGNNEANTLTGTNDADNIYGLGAKDTLNGLGGNDEISGNGGPDTMNGGEGDDTMVGGAGVDSINTGNSTDATGTGGLDFAHAADGNAETLCFGTGDFFFVIDTIDTVKRDTSAPTDCAAGAGTTQIFPETTADATTARVAGTNGVVSGGSTP